MPDLYTDLMPFEMCHIQRLPGGAYMLYRDLGSRDTPHRLHKSDSGP